MAGIQAAYPVVRDILFLLGGFAGIAFQQLTRHVDLSLLGAYLAMLGVPGAKGIMQLRQLSQEPSSGSTPVSPSPSPVPPSSSPSS